MTFAHPFLQDKLLRWIGSQNVLKYLLICALMIENMGKRGMLFPIAQDGVRKRRMTTSHSLKIYKSEAFIPNNLINIINFCSPFARTMRTVALSSRRRPDLSKRHCMEGTMSITYSCFRRVCKDRSLFPQSRFAKSHYDNPI